MFDDFYAEIDPPDELPLEVDPLEVQRIVAALDDLISTVENDTLKVYLHAACEDVGNLLSDGEDESWADAA